MSWWRGERLTKRQLYLSGTYRFTGNLLTLSHWTLDLTPAAGTSGAETGLPLLTVSVHNTLPGTGVWDTHTYTHTKSVLESDNELTLDPDTHWFTVSEKIDRNELLLTTGNKHERCRTRKEQFMVFSKSQCQLPFNWPWLLGRVWDMEAGGSWYKTNTTAVCKPLTLSHPGARGRSVILTHSDRGVVERLLPLSLKSFWSWQKDLQTICNLRFNKILLINNAAGAKTTRQASANSHLKAYNSCSFSS